MTRNVEGTTGLIRTSIRKEGEHSIEDRHADLGVSACRDSIDGADDGRGAFDGQHVDGPRTAEERFGTYQPHRRCFPAIDSQDARKHVVQVDDPGTWVLWDFWFAGQKPFEEFRRFAEARVEMLNFALAGIPPEQVRYHLCWGSWHGPHAYDIPLAEMVDVLLAINAQTYLFEAANVRHEHEYKIWESVKLPEGKILAPGVVSHATPLIEHPDLVSERIQRFAKLVGAQNVIASTDCGLGLRCHPQIAWAKLSALAEGARLATRSLGLPGV